MAEPTWMPVAAETSQRELPRLSGQVVAEAPVPFPMDQAEPGAFVDASRGAQHAVGPQHDLPVARLPREAHALAHEARTDAQPARPRLDQQQAQLGHRRRLLDEEHGADDLAVLLCDPGALPLRVVVLDPTTS